MKRSTFDVDAGFALRELRHARQLPRATVAAWIQVHPSVLTNIEAGIRRLSFSEAVMIAHELDISVEDLVPREPASEWGVLNRPPLCGRARYRTGSACRRIVAAHGDPCAFHRGSS